MSISVLSVHSMLNISQRWITNDEIRDTLSAHPTIGLGVLQQLESAHNPLAELQHKREAAHARLKQLIDLCARLDTLHDRKARALYFSLTALIEGADDEVEATQYRDLQQLLFPTGLRVIRLPFIEEGGAAVALDRAIGPEVRGQLQAIQVGPRTLRDLFEDWMAAGHKLGDAVRRRSEVKASLGRKGSVGTEIDVQAGRKQWLQAVRGLLWALETVPQLASLDEPIRASLDEAVDATLRRRASGTSGSSDELEFEDVGAEVEGDEGGEGGEDDEDEDEALDEPDEVDEDDL